MFWITRRIGIAEDRLRRILRSKLVKGGKVHIRRCESEPKHLIIGIGQIHPVLRVTFERFQAKRIATVQYWIFRLCEYLVKQEEIQCFGKEGFASIKGKSTRARLPLELLKEIKNEHIKGGGTKRVFKRAAEQWRKALHKQQLEKARGAIHFLDALSLLQANHSQVTIFPLERDNVHSAIHKSLNSLQDQVKGLESSAAFRSARSKGGKGLTQKEVQALLNRNKLVQSRNQLLSDPRRDQEIFKNVITQATSESVTVFVLGQGHRNRFLMLARSQMPSDMLFVWITPPQLWLWRAVQSWSGLLLLCFALAILVFLS